MNPLNNSWTTIETAHTASSRNSIKNRTKEIWRQEQKTNNTNVTSKISQTTNGARKKKKEMKQKKNILTRQAKQSQAVSEFALCYCWCWSCSLLLLFSLSRSHFFFHIHLKNSEKVFEKCVFSLHLLWFLLFGSRSSRSNSVIFVLLGEYIILSREYAQLFSVLPVDLTKTNVEMWVF